MNSGDDQEALNNIMQRKWLHRKQRGGSDRYPKWTIYYLDEDDCQVNVAEVTGPERLVEMIMELRWPWMLLGEHHES